MHDNCVEDNIVIWFDTENCIVQLNVTVLCTILLK
ncbi:hypothetical protein LRU_02263 [Ligilactobacillus ruminis SPM0211]|uniref:Uncharacterized protein n=1 Tax=Ligilactobacillus ruminis SPM0211 TaxID=1040964 RepID=F7R3J4_9LACO|nr:hypothetical protein LRU_02263 [Ligilactobacillus ruminis SPM0211]